jgi:hypothetical protein
VRGFADVAVVKADDAKAARSELPAEIVIPMDHLGAEAHDQEQRFRGWIAENFVADVDAVGASDLWRLMGEHRVCLPSSDTVSGNYGMVSRTAEGVAVVDRSTATVWYGPNIRRSVASARNREGERAMADKGNDPAEVWRTMIGEMEKGFNSFANQAMTSPEFSKVMNQVGGVSAGAQKQLGELMEKYLLAMNLPSRAQMVGMAERIQAIEGQLNEIKALLHQVHHNSLAQDGGHVAPRPPRTKRPPSEGGQK